ncbi:MAG: hypothetical protein GVY10_04300 [Verrucomicrobia bacterium]|jgi:hypothetical protein|nr:hypothetical protein [Verrucomicrobiota bacterium]
MAAAATARLLLLATAACAANAGSAQAHFSLENRWKVRDFYTAAYPVPAGLEMGWTGSYAEGNAGRLSREWLAAVETRINFFRSMAGVPADVTLTEALSARAQAAAFLLSVNWQPDEDPEVDPHRPPTTWTFFTDEAAEATARSNIGYGVQGPRAVTDYINDYGPSNHWVGHRRWLLYPQTREMGAGDAPGEGNSGFGTTNAIYVIGTPNQREERPPTRDDFVAWPPPGHVPSDLVFARWSLSYPGADFSAAEVTMRVEGTPVEVAKESLSPASSQIGEPTLVWVPEGFDPRTSHPWPTPDEDETVAITVANVKVGSATRSFSYEVTVFDPAQPGPGETPTALEGPEELLTGEVGSFSVTSRPWAEASELRILRMGGPPPFYGAEALPLPLVRSLSPGYEPRQRDRVANGGHAFHLVMPRPEDQILMLPGEYLVTGQVPALLLQSSLGYATESQAAVIEVNPSGTEGGWREVWRQRGTKEATQSDGFTGIRADLSAYRDQVVLLRLRYTKETGNYYNQTGPEFGWAIDDISLEGLLPIETIEAHPLVGAGQPHRLTFSTADHLYLQARDIAFGGVPLAWGPVRELLIRNSDGPVVRPEEWSEDGVLGWLKGASNPAWGYSPFMGWAYLGAYPWIYLGNRWYFVVAGNAREALWLYRPDIGYVLANAAYEGWFQLAPYDNSLWSRFSMSDP